MDIKKKITLLLTAIIGAVDIGIYYITNGLVWLAAGVTAIVLGLWDLCTPNKKEEEEDKPDDSKPF